MQAYEHIMTTMVKSSKRTKTLDALTLEENLELIRRYGAYFTYPDSVRAIVKLSTDSAFRQPSHMSEGAWMEYVIGDELKKSNNGYPLDKLHIPENLELKAADGPTSLELAKEHNPTLLKTREGQAIYEHLKQDKQTDILFQNHIATCYIDEKDSNIDTGSEYVLYGVSTKAGLARLNQSGKIVSMNEFREIVALTQRLTTFELFRKLREAYPDITFEQIQEAVCASYDENYPDSMMNAKQYSVPSQEEQSKILYALDKNDYSYYEEIKTKLVKKGAFRNVMDIDRIVSGFIDNTTFLAAEQKDRFGEER